MSFKKEKKSFPLFLQSSIFFFTSPSSFPFLITPYSPIRERRPAPSVRAVVKVMFQDG